MVATAALWWLATSCIGWLAWPAAARIFGHSPLHGYAYGRALGLVVLAYPVWLLASLGIVPHTALVTRLIMLVLVAPALGFAWVNRQRLAGILQAQWIHFITIECVYLVLFLVLCVYKAYTPAVEHTEQPMDLMILTTLLRSAHIPPPDAWLAGYSLSYYYGGYFIIAQLAHLVGTKASIAYNLGLVTVFSTAFVIAYGVFYDLLWHSRVICTARRRACQLWSMLGSGFLLLSSNLAGFVLACERLFNVSPTTWLRIVGGTANSGREPWWWWASRAMRDPNLLGRSPEMITEFPAFSLILGDLHPHVLSLPFVLLAIGIAIQIYRSAAERAWYRSAITLVIPLAVGALGWINTWDLPVYALLILACYVCGRYRSVPTWQQRIPDLAGFGGLLLFSLVLYIPFYTTLTTQVQGIAATYYAKSGLGPFMLTSVMLLIPILILTWRTRSIAPKRRFWWLWAGVIITPWLLTIIIGSPGRALLGIGVMLWRGPWVVGLLSALIALLLYRLLTCERTSETLPLLLALFGCGLLYSAEFFAVKDVFNNRMNTYFKFSYQAWILLTIAGGCVLSERVRGKYGSLVTISALIAATLASIFTLTSAWDTLAQPTHSPTLDGASYLAERAPDEYGAILWLQMHAGAQERLVEAAARDYTSGNRLSSFAGVPTLLGWPGHEWQWRGEQSIVRERQTLVDRIYTTTDQGTLLEILAQNGVDYLYIGELEISRYALSKARLQWYATIFEPVYTGNRSSLYRIDRQKDIAK